MFVIGVGVRALHLTDTPEIGIVCEICVLWENSQTTQQAVRIHVRQKHLQLDGALGKTDCRVALLRCS